METFAIQTEQMKGQQAAHSESVIQAASRQSGESKSDGSKSEPDVASAQDVGQAVKDLAMRFELKVELAEDERTGRPVVKIFGPDGGRLIRQMPPEGALKLAAQVRDSKTAGLFSSTA